LVWTLFTAVLTSTGSRWGSTTAARRWRDRGGVGEIGVEPVVAEVVGDDDLGGAVVDPAEGVRRLGGDDHRGPPPPVRVPRAAGGVAPQLVQPREGESGPGGIAEKVGNLPAGPSRHSHS